jgi:hypothetical protein
VACVIRKAEGLCADQMAEKTTRAVAFRTGCNGSIGCSICSPGKDRDIGLVIYLADHQGVHKKQYGMQWKLRLRASNLTKRPETRRDITVT